MKKIFSTFFLFVLGGCVNLQEYSGPPETHNPTINLLIAILLIAFALRLIWNKKK